MTLWPFDKEKGQKTVSVAVLAVGIVLIFTFDNITAGAVLSLLGLVYLLDTI